MLVIQHRVSGHKSKLRATSAAFLLTRRFRRSTDYCSLCDMSSIHFSFNAADRLQTACLISARHYQAGNSLGVYCADMQRLAAFDRLLWDYERAAFVPHVMQDDPLAAETPIVLYTTRPDARHGWVLNLDDDCVPEAGSFDNIIEVVARTESERAGGRARWRAYQAAGHTIVQHDAARNDLP